MPRRPSNSPMPRSISSQEACCVALFFLLQSYHSGEACLSDSRCNCGDGTGSEVSGALLLEDKNLDLIISFWYHLTQVRGYPTLKLFSNGVEVEDYKGGRTKKDIVAYITEKSKATRNELWYSKLNWKKIPECLSYALLLSGFFDPWSLTEWRLSIGKRYHSQHVFIEWMWMPFSSWRVIFYVHLLMCFRNLHNH